jgi:hypothetical protein
VTGMTKELPRENQMVIYLVQALLGLVSPKMLGVALEFSNGAVIVHVAVSQKDDEIVEDIEELIADFQGFLWPDRTEISEKIHAGPANQTWPGREHRLVLLAKTYEKA